MTFDPISALFDLGKTTIERIWPDANKRAEEIRKLEELRDKGDARELDAYVRITLAQIEVNLESAKHKSIFVAGPRPFIIWVGGFSLAWAGIIHPLLTWVWAFAEMLGDPPPLIESAALGSIVTGLLGVAGMRSYDKLKGTVTNKIRSR